MGLTRWLSRIAADAAVPVFAIAGAGARETVQDLRLRPDLRLVETPRAGAVLLIAGAVPDLLALPLGRIHDAMPHPRTTVLAPGTTLGPAVAERLQTPEAVQGDLGASIVAAYRALISGARPSEPPVLPDVDPAPWRGIGPYGQGGTGMTGGVPYGRPLAGLADDRDGLRLDALPVAVGPLFPAFPTGLVVDVRWAGDIVLDAAVSNVLDPIPASAPRPGLAPFVRALTTPVSIAEIETARAREHLRWLADVLAVHGLPALGLRALRIGGALRPAPAAVGWGRVIAAVERLEQLVSRSQLLRWSLPRAARPEPERLAGLGLGPVARAAGLREDLRLDDPAYRALGFEPLVLPAGDAGARVRVRLAEARQSLELAASAARRVTTPNGRIESPRGRLEPGTSPADRLLPLLADALQEIEWGDAVATIVSLDLDLDEATIAMGLRAQAAAA